MITASHLPFNRNGFKFFDNKAGFEKREISNLLNRAAEAAEGTGNDSLEEDDSFPRDKQQAEEVEVAKLEAAFGADKSFVTQVRGFVSSTGHCLLARLSLRARRSAGRL